MFQTFDSAIAAERRRWPTLASFALESLFLAMLLAIPLVKPDVLPALKIGEPITAPYSEPPRAIEVVDSRIERRPLSLEPAIDNSFRAPSRIPIHTDMTPDSPRPSVDNYGPPGRHVPGSVPGFASPTPLLNDILTKAHPAVVLSKEPLKVLRVSNLSEGMLLKRVQPIYPQPARITHTQGTVVLSALINKQGEIEHLQVISGHPLLVQAAIDAVKEWRYRPYLLNGAPVDVETRISVVFSMQ